MNRQIGIGANLAQKARTSACDIRKREQTLSKGRTRGFFRDALWKKANGISGRLQFSFKIIVNDGRTSVFVEIERCLDLAAPGLRRSVSPFVLIRLDGTEVGRTPALKGPKSPFIWHDECYQIPAGQLPAALSFEVWNSGSDRRVGDFLGGTHNYTIGEGEENYAIEEVEIPLKKWGNEDELPVNVNNSTYGTNVQRPVEGERNHSEAKTGEAEQIRIRPSSRPWEVEKRRRSFFIEKPQTYNHNKWRFKIPNPHPYRRRDIRETPDEEPSASCLSSTSCKALLLIFCYLSCGVLGYSFVFEAWSIRDSLYFAVVTFTTVGYGDIRPESIGGKLFACVFALAGIGIIGIALGYIGQSLVQAQVTALQKTQRKISREDTDGPPEASIIESSRTTATTTSSNALRHLAVSLCPITAMVLLGASVVGSYEQWGWVDSVYWAIITGTSVGYGDFFPQTMEMRWFSIIFVPLSVGVISAALGRIANVFVEREIAKSNEKLLRREITLEDLETMNVDGDGEVSLLEFVEHMLLSMHKVDQSLLDELHLQFQRLDADGSGGLQKDDLDILTERKLSERRSLALEKYKSGLLRRGSAFGFHAPVLPIDENGPVD